MSKFASSTTVSSEKSRMEIERILARYGASSFMYGTTMDRAIIAFEAAGRRIKFDLPLPDRNAPEFKRTPAKRQIRSPEQQAQAYEQAIRQRWRALALVIKAKLEAVEAGITEFEEEFLAHIVLPGGQTVGQWMLPQVSTAYETGSLPPLLEGPRT